MLDLLQRNVELNGLQHRATVQQLDWGAEGAARLLPLMSPSAPRCVIAADVVYPDTTDDSMQRLLDTVSALLSSSPAAQPGSLPASACQSSTPSLLSSFLCSYVNRSPATSRRFLRIVQQRGFHCGNVPLSRLTPLPSRQQLQKGEQEEDVQLHLQHLAGYLLLMTPSTAAADWISHEPFLTMCSEPEAQTASQLCEEEQSADSVFALLDI